MKDINKKSKDKKKSKEVKDDLVFEDEETYSNKPEIKLKKLRSKLRQCQKEKSEYLDGWQRAKSDLINIRKRYETEAQEASKLSEQEFAKKILPILDSFSMAVANQSSWEALPDEWKKGMENIHDQLIKVLKSYNVFSFHPLGEEFDPSLHDAVGTVEVNEKEKDNLITEVIQDGYVMDDKTLRTAKVKVGQYTEKKEE